MNPLETFLVHPLELSAHQFWMVIPVSLAVAVVYKTLRTRSLRRLPLEIGLLCLYMIAGIGTLMVGFWALLKVWPAIS